MRQAKAPRSGRSVPSLEPAWPSEKAVVVVSVTVKTGCRACVDPGVMAGPGGLTDFEGPAEPPGFVGGGGRGFGLSVTGGGSQRVHGIFRFCAGAPTLSPFSQRLAEPPTGAPAAGPGPPPLPSASESLSPATKIDSASVAAQQT